MPLLRLSFAQGMFSSHKESTPILQSSFPEPWPPRIPSWCSTEDALFLAQADCIGQTLHTLTVATMSLSSRYYSFLHAVEKDSEMTFSDLVAQNSSKLLMVSGRAFEVQASGTSSLAPPPAPAVLLWQPSLFSVNFQRSAIILLPTS